MPTENAKAQIPTILRSPAVHPDGFGSESYEGSPVGLQRSLVNGTLEKILGSSIILYRHATDMRQFVEAGIPQD